MSEHYEKDFEKGNKRKQAVEESTYIPYFDAGEIWWGIFGINIGVEIDGKGDDFLRPLLVLTKYNPLGCLVVPLSSARKEDKDNVYVDNILERKATANLSQLRSISSKRLVEKITVLRNIDFFRIQKTAMEYNFPSQLFDFPSQSKTESSPKADIS